MAKHTLILVITIITSSAFLYEARSVQRLQLNNMRVDLIHPASPRVLTGANRAERIRVLVEKSNDRVRFLANKLGNSPGTQQDYESPLTPDGGGYVMEIKIGTPDQSFKAIADTGSDLVWVQSKPCTGCEGAVFDPAASSTYKTISCSSSLCSELPETQCGSSGSCTYLYQYGSGMTIGTFAHDTVSLGTASNGTHQFPSFAVGGGRYNQGFDGFEGLVGLGQGPISLTSQLATEIAHKFSYCLVDINSASASSPLFFGESAKLNGTGIQSTPILPSDEYPTYYLLKATGITAVGTSAGNPDTTIIDSGTTLTYVPSEVYDKIKAAFKSAITLPPADGSSVGLDLCYDVSSNKGYKFPSLTIHLEGASLTPPAANYFLAIDESGNTVCLAMGTAEGLPVSIIGNVMQQGYHILYDRGTSTLSFVPANCESL